MAGHEAAKTAGLGRQDAIFGFGLEDQRDPIFIDPAGAVGADCSRRGGPFAIAAQVAQVVQNTCVVLVAAPVKLYGNAILIACGANQHVDVGVGLGNIGGEHARPRRGGIAFEQRRIDAFFQRHDFECTGQFRTRHGIVHDGAITIEEVDRHRAGLDGLLHAGIGLRESATGTREQRSAGGIAVGLANQQLCGHPAIVKRADFFEGHAGGLGGIGVPRGEQGAGARDVVEGQALTIAGQCRVGGDPLALDQRVVDLERLGLQRIDHATAELDHRDRGDGTEADEVAQVTEAGRLPASNQADLPTVGVVGASLS